jgi:hypothetical protein
MFATGLAKRPASAHLRLLGDYRYHGSSAIETVIQQLATLHDQRAKPSCVGQAWGQCVEAAVGTRVSCVDVWEGARTMQGNAGVSEVGTRGEFAWWWLQEHGWTNYLPGEDERPESEDEDYRVGASLADTMQAHQQRRSRVKLVRTISLSQSADAIAVQVVAALKDGMGVVREGATTLAYQRAPRNFVLGPEFFRGDDGGHAERVAGYSSELDAFLVQGSWGDWTSCLLPDGREAHGCCWISRAVLAEAWAIDVIRVR